MPATVPTMRLHYDEDLVEGVVLLCADSRCARVPSLQRSRFHGERERLYAIPDPDERNAAFFGLHLEWFREWGQDDALTAAVKRFPRLAESLDLLAFRKARGKNEEGAELYVSAETGRNAVVALRPERFAEEESLPGFLRHELTHLDDMVDPAFGYSPELRRAGQTAAHERLTRERYRLLWDITIDGRLARTDRATAATESALHRMFDRAYCFWPVERRDPVFESLWREAAPRHEALLNLASDPRDLHLAHAPLPGSPCPLCSFPTFRWADAAALGDGLAGVIQREFPLWTTEQGACARCAEVYSAARRSSLAVAG